MKEDRLTATCTAKDLKWSILLNVAPEAKLPFQNIGGKILTGVQAAHPYQLILRCGTFEDMRSQPGFAFGILPEKGKVEMRMN